MIMVVISMRMVNGDDHDHDNIDFDDPIYDYDDKGVKLMMMTNTTEPRREYVRRNAAGRKNIGKSRQPQRANCIIVESVHPKT